jgi:hypothetical protein
MAGIPLTVFVAGARLRVDGIAIIFTIARQGRLCGINRRKDVRMPPLDILFRQVPEGYEFLGVLFTILGSLIIMVLLGAWWSR